MALSNNPVVLGGGSGVGGVASLVAGTGIGLTPSTGLGNVTVTNTTANAQDDFTGDGVTTVFTLSAAPVGNIATVSVDGVVKTKTTDYTISGTTLTFGSAPANTKIVQAYYSSPSGGGGSVTSVDMSVPSLLQISGAPITTSGTLAVTYSGTALPLANGGTAGTTKAAAFNNLSPMSASGDIIYGGTAGAGTRLPKGTDTQVLTLASGLPSWADAASGSGTVTHTAGNLTASAIMVGNGVADSKVLASLGTTTTVLHGNAAGLPTFGAVSLTTDVTGVLPIANYATGTPTGSKFVSDDGSLKSVPGGGDALTSNPLSQFAATTSAQLRGVLSDETGTGLAVFNNAPTLTGVITSDGAAINTGTAVSGNAIDFTKGTNTQSLSGNVTLTFSGASTARQYCNYEVTADSSARTVTLPANVFPLGVSSALASFVVPASSTLLITFGYDGTNYRIIGNPALVSGTGAFAAVTGATMTSLTADGHTFPSGSGVVLTADSTATVTNKSIAGSQVTGAFTAAGMTIATAKLLGRTTASTGAVEEIAIGSGLSMSSGTLSASGGGTGTKTIAILTPQTNEAPTSNYATYSTRNSHPILEFDDTTQWSAIWSWRAPESTSFSGGLTVYVQWCAVATSGTVGWDVAFERIVAAGLDIDGDSFGSAQTITAATVSGTSGITSTTSVNFSSGQLPASFTAGDMYRIRVRRDVANDTAVGNAQIVQAEVRLQ